MALSASGWKIWRAVAVGRPLGFISPDTPVRFRSALPNGEFKRTQMPDEESKTFDWSEIAQFLPFIASAILAFISISNLYSPAHACGVVAIISFIVGEQMWLEAIFVIHIRAKINGGKK